MAESDPWVSSSRKSKSADAGAVGFENLDSLASTRCISHDKPPVGSKLEGTGPKDPSLLWADLHDGRRWPGWRHSENRVTSSIKDVVIAGGRLLARHWFPELSRDLGPETARCADALDVVETLGKTPDDGKPEKQRAAHDGVPIAEEQRSQSGCTSGQMPRHF